MGANQFKACSDPTYGQAHQFMEEESTPSQMLTIN